MTVQLPGVLDPYLNMCCQSGTLHETKLKLLPTQENKGGNSNYLVRLVKHAADENVPDLRTTPSLCSL